MSDNNRPRARAIFLAAEVLLALASGPLWAQAPGTPESYVRYGREAYAAQSYGMAATNFRQAATLRPDNAEYQFLLAAALMSDRRPDEAREFFAKALQLDPSLQPQVDAWLANARPARPAAAAAAPQPPQPMPEPPRPRRGQRRSVPLKRSATVPFSLATRSRWSTVKVLDPRHRYRSRPRRLCLLSCPGRCLRQWQSFQPRLWLQKRARAHRRGSATCRMRRQQSELPTGRAASAGHLPLPRKRMARARS